MNKKIAAFQKGYNAVLMSGLLCMEKAAKSGVSHNEIIKYVARFVPARDKASGKALIRQITNYEKREQIKSMLYSYSKEDVMAILKDLNDWSLELKDE